MDGEFSMFQEAINNQSSEKGVYAEFYDKTVKTEHVNELGFPVFKNITYIRIQLKDNPDTYDQPAGQDYIRRFPVEYNRYLMGKKAEQDGTPLTQFAFLTGDELAMCKFHGIFTIEKLAELPDDKTHALNLFNEREAAKRFIEVSKNNKAIADYAKKEKEYKAEIKQLKEQIKELQAAKKEAKED